MFYFTILQLIIHYADFVLVEEEEEEVAGEEGARRLPAMVARIAVLNFRLALNSFIFTSTWLMSTVVAVAPWEQGKREKERSEGGGGEGRGGEG